ncbi:colicin E3/pyocin S6 family cytotoxin [Treponema endosymbiont of Eucomonympha sp.]|uniref:colicin E3/pyocin S6 family cytotoxin n=1 Tax=Treponema endosymbiont of Eucomonympha sp. TaxID=1580831 RepID=UPI0035A07714
MANKPVPPNSFLRHQRYLGWKNNQRLWQAADGDYYTWDSLHGEIEWYNKNGTIWEYGTP